MESNLSYLNTYELHQDFLILLPKSKLTNLSAEKGSTKFDIYLDVKSKELVLSVNKEEE